MISLRNESPSALKSIWSLRRAHQADAEFVAKIFASSRPRLQGQGLGSHLLAAAKEESPRGLRLHVFQRNLSARRFYEQRGFKLVKLRDRSSNEEGEPDAVYEWIASGPPA